MHDCLEFNNSGVLHLTPGDMPAIHFSLLYLYPQTFMLFGQISARYLNVAKSTMIKKRALFCGETYNTISQVKRIFFSFESGPLQHLHSCSCIKIEFSLLCIYYVYVKWKKSALDQKHTGWWYYSYITARVLIEILHLETANEVTTCQWTLIIKQTLDPGSLVNTKKRLVVLTTERLPRLHGIRG